MLEKPVDRLNYYNGQRLEASDLKLEQEYHIRMRRWLNKSLYEPGIANGLTIRPEKDGAGKNTHNVIISPGLALDAEGREILLLEETSIPVQGQPQKPGAGADDKVQGLYLTIRYDEKSIQEERNSCSVQSVKGNTNGSRPAWGGPALVRAKPVFNWRDAPPYESSGEIILGQVELTDKCIVAQVNAGVRPYVGAASEAKVRQYALEGERHIDKDNPGRIYFHIRGRQPKSVTLYLRADRFSSLFYTELGHHKHNLQIAFADHVFSRHDHSLRSVRTKQADDGSEHDHKMLANLGDFLPNTGGDRYNAFAFTYMPNSSGEIYQRHHHQDPNDHITGTNGRGEPSLEPLGLEFTGGGHRHSFDNNEKTGEWPETRLPHVANATNGSSDDAGVPEWSARVGHGVAALTYINDLDVRCDGVSLKKNIVEQLNASSSKWSKNGKDMLGDGSPTHPLVQDGTGPIKLDFLRDVRVTEGEHVLEFSVNGEGNGGRLLYNLYVE